MDSKRSILFYRDYRRFSGGHLKVWHYYNHVQHSPYFRPEIVFSDESVWDAGNPWAGSKTLRMSDLPALKPDVLFIGGMDWEALDPYMEDFGHPPVINLIQHVMHADLGNPRYQFLNRRAIRICVSEDVRQALTDTSKVNGPLYAIPNGLDLAALPAAMAPERRDVDLLLDGIKTPQLTRRVLPLLQAAGLKVHALTQRVPREEYLAWINRARMTLFLPRAREGFFLPALEGMALGTLVICPDCEGNRSFCLDGVNSLRPEYKTGALLEAVETARRLAPVQVEAMAAAARATVAKHDLLAERRAFLEILDGFGETV